MIQKTNRMNLVEQVAMQMEQLIEKRTWQVGEKLPPEFELMDKFDVSRNTLREAIRALVHAGMLETKQGSGTVVCSANSLGATLKRYLQKSALLEILDVRLALERQAAELAAVHRTDADLDQLEQSIQATRLALANQDRGKFIAEDIAFHKMIVQAAGNQLLSDLYEPLLERIYAFVDDVITMYAPLQLEHEFHFELFAAIRDQDQKAAAAYVENYLGGLRNKIVEWMEE